MTGIVSHERIGFTLDLSTAGIMTLVDEAWIEGRAIALAKK
jgi:hypothetical protein